MPDDKKRKIEGGEEEQEQEQDVKPEVKGEEQEQEQEQKQEAKSGVPDLGYFPIGKLKRLTVSKFKGMTRIDLREYYEKNGEHLPGKKGINLSVDEWKELIGFVTSVDAAIEHEASS